MGTQSESLFMHVLGSQTTNLLRRHYVCQCEKPNSFFFFFIYWGISIQHLNCSYFFHFLSCSFLHPYSKLGTSQQHQNISIVFSHFLHSIFLIQNGFTWGVWWKWECSWTQKSWRDAMVMESLYLNCDTSKCGCWLRRGGKMFIR